jgi:hypothetical protein
MITIDNKSVIGMSDGRSGSSYVFDVLYQLKKQIPNNTPSFYLQELFHERMSDDFINLDANNNIVTAINNLNEYKLADCNIDIDERRRIASHNLECISKTNNQFVFKTLVEHMDWINETDYLAMLNRENVVSFFLYRRDLEDQALSKLLADATHIYKSADIVTYDNVLINWTASEYEVLIRGVLDASTKLINTWYPKIDWDIVTAYEDLSGDPVEDFQKYYNQMLTPLSFHLKKLLSKDEKRNKLHNYSVFKDQFDKVIEEYGVPSMLEDITK